MKKSEIIAIAQDYVESRYQGLDPDMYDIYVDMFAKGFDEGLFDKEYEEEYNENYINSSAVDTYGKEFIDGYDLGYNYNED